MFSIYAIRNAFAVAIATFGYLAVAHLAHGAPIGSDGPKDGCHLYESECSVRPLATGGTVRVCEHVKLECSWNEQASSKPAQRIGKTTVTHIGARTVHMAPLVVRARKPVVVAAR